MSQGRPLHQDMHYSGNLADGRRLAQLVSTRLWVLRGAPEHSGLAQCCSQGSWGRAQQGRDPPGHLHGDFALFIAEPCATDTFLCTLQIPTSYLKRKNPAKLLTPESANLCLVLTFGCHFTLPNKFCPFPVLSQTTETPSAQPATKTNSSPPLNTVINSPCSKLKINKIIGFFLNFSLSC